MRPVAQSVCPTEEGPLVGACTIIDPNGELSLKGGTLYCDSESIKVHVKVKIDGKWHRKTFEFSSEDLEFES